MTDIVERLRQTAHLHAVRPTEHCCWEAADTIATLRATNERLRAALEIISSGWETPPMEYMTSSRALARFMWKTATTALAEEKKG